MPYKLTQSAILNRAKQRIKGTLLINMKPNVQYSMSELAELLRDYGLDYSEEDLLSIGQTLINENFLEEI